MWINLYYVRDNFFIISNAKFANHLKSPETYLTVINAHNVSLLSSMRASARGHIGGHRARRGQPTATLYEKYRVFS